MLTAKIAYEKSLSAIYEFSWDLSNSKEYKEK
jgi:hypothetical protein